MAAKNIYKWAGTLSAMIFCLAFFMPLKSRSQALFDLNNKVTEYERNALHEKLYVHINKNAYVTGDILWFKIYNADGGTNKLLDISKVAYVELSDNNHVPVMQTKIALKGGMGNGSLYIPFSLNTGNYQLRAYTNWMKNFGAGHFFESEVTIINPLKTPALSAKPTTPLYDVQFFPEGGHLVRNLDNRIAFKVTGADGKGPACMGAVLNQHNDTVARFRSLKFGIGSFMMRPLAGKTYKAVIKAGNTTVVKDMPEMEQSGYVMRTINSGQSWDIEVRNTDSTLSSTVYLMAYGKHATQFAAGSKLVNGAAHFMIDNSKLAGGVSYVTLFDERQRPVCERLIFKRPAKNLLIDAGTDQALYNKRKKVSLTVSSRSRDNTGVAADLSISVFRADELQNDAADHIGGYLWLRSDLKGAIESPDYYLENISPESDLALDNLMLSQGWTQFDWKTILAGNKPHFKFLPEYTGPIIAARITNTINNTPAKNITAYLTIPGTTNDLYIARSDSAGQLLFNTRKFYDLREIVIQTNRLLDSTYRIDVTSPFSEPGATAVSALTLNEGLKNALMDNSLDMQVQNIFAANRLKQFYNPDTDSIPFYGFPTKTYLLDNYTRFTTIEEVLREYVTSIGVSKRQGKFNIRMYNGDQDLGNPLILLDGVPVFDADKIFRFDPLKVRRLDVVSTNYRYGPGFFNGIMSFTTYKGDGSTYEIDPHALVVDYEGLQEERKFYSPVYDTDAQISGSVPDFRTALYWDPSAYTPADGKNTFVFYTGDKPGRYIGVIEGLSATGEPGSKTFTFEIKK